MRGLGKVLAPVVVLAMLGFAAGCDVEPNRGAGIDNDNTVGTRDSMSADERIEDAIDRRFAEDDMPDLDERDLRFDVENGVVTINGEVRTAAAKQQVEQRVRGVAGVTSVINNLEIEEEEVR